VLANFINQHNINHNYISHNHNYINHNHNYTSHNHHYANSAISNANTSSGLCLHWSCIDAVHIGYHFDYGNLVLDEDKRKTTESGIQFDQNSSNRLFFFVFFAVLLQITVMLSSILLE
jgi:hypothetical protein